MAKCRGCGGTDGAVWAAEGRIVFGHGRVSKRFRVYGLGFVVPARVPIIVQPRILKGEKRP